MGSPRIFRSAAWAAAFSLSAVGAGAQDAPPASSLQSYAAQNAQCLEWTDACGVCKRDEAGAAHCSTPGIACQPVEIACVKSGQ